VNFNCPNFLVVRAAAGPLWIETCDGVLAVANESNSKSMPGRGHVNDRYWCSASFSGTLLGSDNGEGRPGGNFLSEPDLSDPLAFTRSLPSRLRRPPEFFAKASHRRNSRDLACGGSCPLEIGESFPSSYEIGNA
jgi:hypothetical protein